MANKKKDGERIDVTLSVSRQEIAMCFMIIGKLLTEEMWKEIEAESAINIDRAIAENLEEENVLQLRMGMAMVVVGKYFSEKEKVVASLAKRFHQMQGDEEYKARKQKKTNSNLS